MSDDTKPRLALDMYVLAQGIKTGVYRVCDELFPLLARSPRLGAKFLCRPGDEPRVAAYAAQRLGEMPVAGRVIGAGSSARANILLSPFGVAPADWLTDPGVLQAHIIYDLIGINQPDFFSDAAADEVRRIVDSLGDQTVIFAISECTKADLLQCRPDLTPSQITVIRLAAGPAFAPNGDAQSKADVRARYRIPAGVPYVLSLATLEIRKNLGQVVNAFVHCLQQHPDSALHLVLAGMSGWKLEQLESALAAAGRWRERIVLTGFVDDEHLSALYADALCFVYLSRYEGFGLPPLEAMACGTPVLCANNSSLPEVVGDAGLLFDADDIEGVAAAIDRLMQSTRLCKELSEAGIRRAATFNWSDCAALVEETLLKAFARHARRPFNRLPRQLAPGALPAKFGQSNPIQANILDYQNGSVGPHWPRLEGGEPANPGRWPVWADALTASPAPNRVEGGLRTRGILKSGTVAAPLVSYITVVRNNTETLERTLLSVQGQTYANVEHIVIDGASTDGTLELIRRHADSIDYFASEADESLYDAINKAIPLARGQLICVVNSDDWLDPDAAEIAANRMRGRSNAALLLTTAHVLVDSDRIFEWNPHFVHPGCYFRCANDCHNGIYANRAAYEQAGGYDISYRIVADFKWIMTCLDAGLDFVYTRELTVHYSLGGTSGDVRQHSVECMRVVSERYPFLSSAEVSGLYHCFFELAGDVRNEQSDRPPNLTTFVREMFGKYQDRPDFTRALTWASMAKLEHPRDVAPVAPVVPAPTQPQRQRRSAKQRIKRALKKVRRLFKPGRN